MIDEGDDFNEPFPKRCYGCNAIVTDDISLSCDYALCEDCFDNSVDEN